MLVHMYCDMICILKDAQKEVAREKKECQGREVIWARTQSIEYDVLSFV